MSPRLATVTQALTVAEQQRYIIGTRPLVFKIANELRYTGPAYEDLVQEGCLGLCIAARKFDPMNGAKFSTYASHWIRAQMLAYAINTKGPVRFGSTKNQRRIFYNLGRMRRRFDAAGVTPTTEQLATVLDVTAAELEEALPRMDHRDWSLDATYDTAEFSDRRRVELSDTGERVDDLFEIAQSEADSCEMLRKALASLKPRDRAIIRARFLREEPLTLQEVGDAMGISRERVRQCQSKALEKLRKRLVGVLA